MRTLSGARCPVSGSGSCKLTSHRSLGRRPRRPPVHMLALGFGFCLSLSATGEKQHRQEGHSQAEQEDCFPGSSRIWTWFTEEHMSCPCTTVHQPTLEESPAELGPEAALAGVLPGLQHHRQSCPADGLSVRSRQLRVNSGGSAHADPLP